MRHDASATAPLVAVLLATLLVGAFAASAASAQTPPLTLTGYVPRSGISVVVMDQAGGADDVVLALAGSGCVASTVAIAQRGAYLVYVSGAPAFANLAFPAFLSPGTPLAIRCAPGPTTVSATVVTRFVPDRPADTTQQDGSCFTSSLALAGRTDAWRCTVGNAIHDPCFALADGALVCGANPTAAETGFLLNLTEPLPATDVSPTGVESASRNGWLVELEDGSVCGFNTGATAGINDQRANYGCPNDEWIFGDLMPGTVWTGMLGTITVSEAGYRLGAAREVVIGRVWQ